MRRLKEKMVDKEDLYVGIDLPKQRWHVIKLWVSR